MRKINLTYFIMTPCTHYVNTHTGYNSWLVLQTHCCHMQTAMGETEKKKENDLSIQKWWK